MKIAECPETMAIPGRGQTYWSESDVKDGKWVVLPTMRVAKLHHVTDCGRKVFITPRSGSNRAAELEYRSVLVKLGSSNGASMRAHWRTRGAKVIIVSD
jgi:hypothetical protein